MRTNGRAVVLGGGGVAGIGWEAGLLAGLADAGVDLGTADMIIGTSAGSVVGTYLAHGADPRTVLTKLTEAAHATPMNVDMDRVVEAMALTFDETVEPLEARRKVGLLALEAELDESAARLGGVRDLLPATDWPARRLLVTAVRAADGAFTVFDAASGAPLPDAVAASCAVPCAFPPVEVNGLRYVDGGVRSPTNADLAEGAAAVVIIEPLAHMLPRTILDREITKLGEAHVVTVGPDETAITAFGDNVLDQSVAEPTYTTGYAQATKTAEQLTSIWE